MKKFICAVLALVMVLSLAACGSKQDDNGGKTDVDLTAQEVLDKLKETLGDSYGCDAQDDEDRMTNYYGLDMSLPEITTLAKKYGARVMVDDAHAFGVIGEGGRGSASYFGLEQEIDIYMGTFSKSMASLGGYMAADARVCDYVRCNSRPYIFSASVPPANIAVATAALRHLKAHPELPRQLLDISQYMRDGLHARGVKIIDADTPIIPIYTYDPIVTLKAQKELYERGVYVNATLPPACAPGECLLRCTLMATHTKALVDEAVDIIADVLHQYDL